MTLELGAVSQQYLAQFKTFFFDEHQNWQETQPLSAGVIYPSENFLGRNAYKTIAVIKLLDATAVSNCKTYSNLSTTVTSIKA